MPRASTPVRRGYNAAASQVESQEPERSPHACAAYGCPIVGSISREGGKKLCFVHDRCRSADDWPDTTRLLRQHETLVEVSRLMRRSVDPMVEQGAIRQAQQLAGVPVSDDAVRRFGARLALVLAVEAKLIALADPSHKPRPEAADPQDDIRAMANKFRQRVREATPDLERMEGRG